MPQDAEHKAEHKAELARWNALRVAMRDLLHESAWEVYANELEQAWLEHMERDLMRNSEYGQIRYYQGVIDGLRRAHALPATLIARADQVIKEPA